MTEEQAALEAASRRFQAQREAKVAEGYAGDLLRFAHALQDRPDETTVVNRNAARLIEQLDRFWDAAA